MSNEGDTRFYSGKVEVYWRGDWVNQNVLPNDWRQQSDSYVSEQQRQQEQCDRRTELKAFAQWLDRQKEIEQLNTLKRQLFQVFSDAKQYERRQPPQS